MQKQLLFDLTIWIISIFLIIKTFVLPVSPLEFHRISNERLAEQVVLVCDRMQDSLALVDLHRSTNGLVWDNVWNLGQPMDTWYGVTLNTDGCVVSLSLPNNFLDGPFPSTLGNLSSLTHLDLSSNFLFEELPSGLGNLTQLQTLFLDGNDLEGPLPTDLSDLTALSSIDLSANHFSGCFPDSYDFFCSLGPSTQYHSPGYKFTANRRLPWSGDLERLCNGESQIGAICDDGTPGTTDEVILPDCSCAVPPTCRTQDSLSLVTLYNATNGPEWTNTWDLNQPIDTWYGVTLNAEGCVERLDFGTSGNKLSGTIPPTLEHLEHLNYLNMRGNQLTGSIPAWIGNMTNLNRLSLGFNQLSGSIPPELGNLTNLQYLFLEFNQLSGAIPPELGSLSELRYLWLSHNQLSGNIPPELGNLSKVYQFYLDENQLSGPIPAELGNLTSVSYLYMYRNQLSGPIPPSLGDLPNLWFLELFDNQLTGSIPAELGSLPQLLGLALYNNQLQGSIPKELGDIATLRSIGLGENNLTGTIPPELANLGALTRLSLQGNNLQGSLPAEFENLQGLTNLDLSHNQIDGVIPSYLGTFSDLYALKLNDNNFSGPIPPTLANLNNLTHIYLQNNQLEGCFPEELQLFCSLGFNNGNTIYGGYNFTNNPNLPGGGDFQAFCETGAGSCSQPPLCTNLLTPTNGATDIPINTSITWAAADGNPTGYLLSLGTSPGATNLLDSLDVGNVTSYVPPLLPYGNTIYSTIIPYNEHGEATACIEESFTTEYSCRYLDSLVLIDLYYATGGPDWTVSWDLNQPIDTWFGVMLSAEGCVSCLDFDGTPDCSYFGSGGNNLSGMLPSDIGDLASLTGLFFAYNDLQGNLPGALGNLTNLTVVSLANNKISGSIPPSIGQLINLSYFDLSNNQLTGSIPSEIGALTNLEWLDMRVNQLQDTIPMSLGELTELRALNLSNNPLTGHLPASLGNLTNLSTLNISGTNISGVIPPTLGNLYNLRNLYLKDNDLTGPIPPELGNLSSLNHLDLYFNELEGPIPLSLGQLSTLTRLQLYGNQLSDSIPPSLGNLTNLQFMHLGNNALSGAVPSTFSNLINLLSLDLANNELEELPDLSTITSWRNIPSNGLNVYGNKFTFEDILPNQVVFETWPSSVYAPQSAILQDTFITYAEGLPFTIDLGIDDTVTTNIYKWYKDGQVYQAIDGSNQLTFDALTFNDTGIYTVAITNPNAPNLALQGGPINLQVVDRGCRFRDSLILVALYEATNGPGWTNPWDLSQPMSAWTGITLNAAGCVERLELLSGGLSGYIPTELGNLSALKYLNLSRNQLEGPIPVELANLSLLIRLDLNDNQLTGVIPSQLGNLPNLTNFYLGRNQVGGTIPEELGNLSQLNYLDLSDNEFDGIIPAALGSLSNLNGLFLSNNQLSGSIPFELGNLSQLNYLMLQENQLTGAIPLELGNLEDLSGLYLHNNQLDGALPVSLGNLINLNSLYCQGNEFTGCFPESYSIFCALGYNDNFNFPGYNFTNNPGLPGGGNFSNFCSEGTGTCMSTCNDGIQNGNETGIDCGGPDCAPCSCELLASWFEGPSGTVTEMPTMEAADIEAGSLTYGPGVGTIRLLQYGNPPPSFGLFNVASPNLDEADYFSLSLSTISGEDIEIEHLQFDLERDGGGNLGASNWAVKSSLDSFSSILAAGTISSLDIWETITIPLDASGLAGNAIELRVYAYGAENDNGRLYFDNIEICGHKTDCIAALTVNDLPISQNIYHAGSYLLSDGEVWADSSVTFKAGVSISLLPGFKAEEGSSFRAFIEDCVPVNDLRIPEQEVIAAQAELAVAGKLRLYPNPAREVLKLEYTLPAASSVRMVIWDSQGKEKVSRIIDRWQEAGYHETSIGLDGFTTGIYIVSLITDQGLYTQRLMVAR